MSEHMIIRSFCNGSKRVTLDDLDAIVRNFYRHPDFVVPVQFPEDGTLEGRKPDLGKVTEVRRVGIDLLASIDTELMPAATVSAEIFEHPPEECGIGGEGRMLRRLVVIGSGVKMEWD
jgi:hypothetical protein